MKDDLYFHGLIANASAGLPVVRNAVPWVRDPSWAALPVVLSTDQKFVGLHAVWQDANFCSFSVTGGGYTVDWGDGSAPENFASAVQAYHEYTYATAALANTNAPVTFTDAGDAVGRVAHGFTNGMPLCFYNITSTTGVVENTPYYVINASANAFQISLTPGGAAVALTTNGTATLLPYKQAIVTVTMQSGQNMTGLNLYLKHNQASLQNKYSTGWLDIAFGSSHFTYNGLVISGTVSPYHSYLERVTVTHFGGTTTLSAAFTNCVSLQQVVLASTALVTDTSNMFAYCNSLSTVPTFDTSAVTTMVNMFSNCYALAIAPTLNTSQVTNMASMFTSCYMLTTVPLYDTHLVTSMQGMFQSCFTLTKVPLFVTTAVTNMASMFTSCAALLTVPLFDMRAVTTTQSMFQSCGALTTVPAFNTPLLTLASSMFNSCYTLTTVPLFDTHLVTTMASMFSGCQALITAPAFNTAAATNMSNMFNSCAALMTVPLFDTHLVTLMTSMFSGCLVLTAVPLFDTSAVTNMSGMFSSCKSLMRVPLFNTAQVTTMATMFFNCLALRMVPLFNTAAVTDVTSMFASCSTLENLPAFNFASVLSGNLASAINNLPQLSSVKLTGIRFSFSVANCKLSAARLNELYGNLPVVVGQTITVTGNYGTATDDTSIATAKGWTVTG